MYYLPESEAYDKLGEPGISSIVQSTISMHSMLMLEESGGMPPKKSLKNKHSEIEFEGISKLKYLYLHDTASQDSISGKKLFTDEDDQNSTEKQVR